jgi:hypothetical protein
MMTKRKVFEILTTAKSRRITTCCSSVFDSRIDRVRVKPGLSSATGRLRRRRRRSRSGPRRRAISVLERQIRQKADRRNRPSPDLPSEVPSEHPLSGQLELVWSGANVIKNTAVNYRSNFNPTISRAKLPW